MVDFYVDRGVTHEIVRHRLASFTQESTRFVNYAKKMPASFVIPPDMSEEQKNMWNAAIGLSEGAYTSLLSNGCSPQIARSVFPNALASRLIMTCNLRNWRHFLIMRTTREAHPQMRQVTIPLLEQFKERIPILFDDIEPMAKQSEAIKKGR
jgi:thymidylate synthase (FAD)